MSLWCSCCEVEREEKARSPGNRPKCRQSAVIKPLGNGGNIGIGLLQNTPRSEQICEADLEDEGLPGVGLGVKYPSPELPVVQFNSEKSGSGKARVSASGWSRCRSSRLLLDAMENENDDEDEASSEKRRPESMRESCQAMNLYNSSGQGASMGDSETGVRKVISSVGGVASYFKTNLKRGMRGSRGPKDAETASPPSPSSSPQDQGALAAEKKAKQEREAMEKKSALQRRNSQLDYAKKAQTAIIFDWDDTLFPTTYLIDDLHLNHKKPLKEQKLGKDLMEEVGSSLAELEKSVLNLLQLAVKSGKATLVTLARAPWVDDSCKAFYPQVGQLIKKLDIKVVYAQEGVQVDYNKRSMMSDDQVEQMYSAMKGKAIAREVEGFYSQYEGQTWKNVLSIGDSDFERKGTLMMSEEYMKGQGYETKGKSREQDDVAINQAFSRKPLQFEKDGHVIRLRTKTFKMLDCPTIGELKEETELLVRWLPKMVKLDDGFDADLSALNDPKLIQNIEHVLDGRSRARTTLKS